MQITYLSRTEVYHFQASLNGSLHESRARRSLDFFFVEGLDFSVQVLINITKIKKMWITGCQAQEVYKLRSDLIECIKIFANISLEFMNEVYQK